MWREVLRIVNSATVEGLADAGTPPTHEADFYAALRHSNEVFAAFKVHNMGRLMASKLFGADGKLKPFNKWAEEVEPITSHHVGAWLRTEYDTALIRAHNAADWRRFERDKDVMPNLRWMPTTSPTPESSHRAFWERRLTLPVDDPFWNRHHPGDRWNCKCSLEQTDDPATPELKGEFDGERPQRGLENNTGRDGHTRISRTRAPSATFTVRPTSRTGSSAASPTAKRTATTARTSTAASTGRKARMTLPRPLLQKRTK